MAIFASKWLRSQDLDGVLGEEEDADDGVDGDNHDRDEERVGHGDDRVQHRVEDPPQRLEPLDHAQDPERALESPLQNMVRDYLPSQVMLGEIQRNLRDGKSSQTRKADLPQTAKSPNLMT
eukprot:1330378-Rhodomonas_salina.1